MKTQFLMKIVFHLPIIIQLQQNQLLMIIVIFHVELLKDLKKESILLILKLIMLMRNNTIEVIFVLDFVQKIYQLTMPFSH